MERGVPLEDGLVRIAGWRSVQTCRETPPYFRMRALHERDLIESQSQKYDSHPGALVTVVDWVLLALFRS